MHSIEDHVSQIATIFKNPNNTLTLNFPKPTKESREALAKMVLKSQETFRLKIRGIRNSVISVIKTEKGISEDFIRKFESTVQNKHDEAMNQLNSLSERKRREIFSGS